MSDKENINPTMVNVENLEAWEVPSLAAGSVTEPVADFAIAREATGDDLPPGYYKSFSFIGTLVALCVSSWSCYLYLLMSTAVLTTTINNALGPSSLISWFAIARTVAQAISFTIIGRLSDIFGRRYFFIGGNATALLGIIITAVAPNIATLIVGAAFTGIGEAVQLSFSVAMGELVKNKHRPLVVSFIFATSAPFATFGTVMSTSMIANGYSWRWCFYLPMICVGLSLVLFIFCYHPPDYRMLHVTGGKTKFQQMKELDYVGMFLFAGGLILFLMPLSWGGNLYPWNSPATIATMVIGLLMLVALGFWGSFANHKLPAIPTQLFANRGFISLVACATVGSCFYYSSLILWPQQIARIYGITGTYAGWLACTIGGATALGTATSGLWITYLGNSRWIITGSAFCMVGFVTSLATLNPGNLGLGVALTILGPYFVGVIETASLALAPLFCRPEDLGLASGLLGSIRAGGASVAVTVYSTILANRLATTIPTAVAGASMAAGFDQSNLAALVAAAKTGVYTGVPGATANVISAVKSSLPNAYSQAFTTVYLASLGFGGLAIIASFVTKNAASFLTEKVERKLHGFDLKTKEKSVDDVEKV